ncbi:2-dehydro-3-deoxyphosphooctonate aldolase [Devosia sp.]|uniref:2-dehydro-3-deoxyphosphooctonate aldolase n=1 Tax=Devosia sp. TaxID=1871048 RepID=UPI003A8FC76C
MRGPATGLALAIVVVTAAVVLVLGVRHMSRMTPTDDTPQVYDRSALVASLSAAGHQMGDPAHVRIFKRENRLELWLAGDDGRYSKFRDYEICRYSGELGPKLAEGDRQAPEGFYRVGLAQLNPNSRHHLSFNLGFPNAYDRQHDRTGSALMVHGGCSSIGCYAITDAHVDEVYAVVEAALKAGQDAVDVHVFPFRLSSEALSAAADAPWLGFWRNLKQGYDLFEAQRQPPKVAACAGRYVFGTEAEGSECAAIVAWS